MGDVLEHVLVSTVAHVRDCLLLHLLLVPNHIWSWWGESIIRIGTSSWLWSIEEWIGSQCRLHHGRKTLSLILDPLLWGLPLLCLALEQVYSHASTF